MARRTVLAGALAALLASCAGTSSAPPGWLPSIEHAGNDPYGAWTEVSYSKRWHGLQVRGELVAVEPETLYVLSDSTMVAVPLEAIGHARVWPYTPGGPAADARYSHRPLIADKFGTFEQLRKYARFPAGLPAGLDARTLRPRALAR